MDVKNLHKSIIDEYFSNGFNSVKAVLKFRPDLEYQQAANLGHQVLKADKNKPYIDQKQGETSEQANVKAYQIAQELKGIAFLDPTQFIGLTESEIKQISPGTRRAIKKITTKRRVYRYNDGSESEEITTTIEAHDKLKALQELGKIIGVYEVDNRQKNPQINLNQFNIKELNTILSALTTTPKD